MSDHPAGSSNQSLQQHEEEEDSPSTLQASSAITFALSPATIRSQTPYIRAERGSTSVSHSLNEGFLRSQQEADLLSHYIHHLSHFFDAGDPRAAFALEVPQRARQNRTLLNAIFALSARYLSHTVHLDGLISDEYLRSCLHTLIPALDDREAVREDSIFAAVVLLRFLEEIEAREAGPDRKGHRLGTQAIISTLGTNPSAYVGDFRRNCYWAAYRQEFSFSLMNQRTMEWTVPSSIRMEHPTDDFDWVLMTFQHCAAVLEYCFDDQGVQNQETFAAVMDQLETWQHIRPPSFDPLFTTPSNPVASDHPIALQIRLHAEQHAVGHAYNVLGHALMMAHTPLPKIGPRRRHQTQQVDEAVRTDVYTLCAIAVANVHFPCPALVACVAISLFGDRFMDHAEQAVLRHVLVETERMYTWPTAQTLTQLEEVWNVGS